VRKMYDEHIQQNEGVPPSSQPAWAHKDVGERRPQSCPQGGACRRLGSSTHTIHMGSCGRARRRSACPAAHHCQIERVASCGVRVHPGHGLVCVDSKAAAVTRSDNNSVAESAART
jgi:hypothetical protein